MPLFIIMLVVTTIEVVLISKVGSVIGFFNTFIIIIFTAMLGSWLLKKQWRHVVGKMQTLQSEPSQAMLEALILLLCGVLLVTPGFLTDIIGFLGLIPQIRERFVNVLRKNSTRMSARGGFTMHTRSQQSPFESRRQSDDHVIEGEYEETDKDNRQ